MSDTREMVKEFHVACDARSYGRQTGPIMPEVSMSIAQELKEAAGILADLAKHLHAAAKQHSSLDLVRMQLLVEELGELSEAMGNRDAVETLDALADLQYVLDGGVLTLGFEDFFDAAFREVHASNMTKADPVTGKMVKDGAGRVQKPAHYRRPDLGPILKDWKKEPETIGELKAQKKDLATVWKPRDLFISMLREIDGTKNEPDPITHCVVLYMRDNPDSDRYTIGWRRAGGSKAVAVGVADMGISNMKESFRND